MTDTPSRPAPQQACPECKGAGGWASTARGRGVGGQMMTMCEACNGTGTAPQQEQAALLAKHQPCGCVVCTCEDDLRCHGCGARHCGAHPVSEIPNAVYVQPAAGGEVTVTDERLLTPDELADIGEGILRDNKDHPGAVKRVLLHHIAALQAQLAALQRDHAASAARVWIPAWERLPMKPDARTIFEEQACIVTDGTRVGVAYFQRGGGHICDAWAAWSRYGDISPECITKWMPMPLPDAALAQPDAARAEGASCPELEEAGRLIASFPTSIRKESP